MGCKLNKKWKKKTPLRFSGLCLLQVILIISEQVFVCLRWLLVCSQSSQELNEQRSSTWGLGAASLESAASFLPVGQEWAHHSSPLLLAAWRAHPLSQRVRRICHIARTHMNCFPPCFIHCQTPSLKWEDTAALSWFLRVYALSQRSLPCDQ